MNSDCQKYFAENFAFETVAGSVDGSIAGTANGILL